MRAAYYYWGMEHPDHRTTGQMTLDAAYPSARDYLAYPDLYHAGLAGWEVKDVYLYQFSAENIDTYVDIGNDTIMTAKINALSQHKSQYSNATALAEGVRAFARVVAANAAVGGVSSAEGFMHVPMLP